MGLSSLQDCMDSQDWLQGSVHEEGRMDSSSSPSGDIITCSRPMLEKRLRPPHDQALKCPRCDSTHTKFCYYNNYSLTQPRYFCKTCRRYWTKGGSLRNIPVGGGCRKNKKVSTKKSSSNDQSPNQIHLNLSSQDATDLHLSYPELHLSQFNTFLGNNGELGNPSFALLEHPRQVEFMENKYDSMLGSLRNHDFIGNTDLGLVGGVGDVSQHTQQYNFNGLCSPYGNSYNGNGTNFMETCQRVMHPFDGSHEDPNANEMKPNKQLLSLDWQDQGCSEVGKDSYGYFNGIGSWSGMMNGYGSSAANPLV